MKSTKQLIKEAHKLFNKKHSFTIKDIVKYEVFDLNHIIFFENNLYERLNKNFAYKYRIILNSDDYDYVCDRNLKRRLDRAFAKK
jgi:hypothetical protein